MFCHLPTHITCNQNKPSHELRISGLKNLKGGGGVRHNEIQFEQVTKYNWLNLSQQTV